LVNYDDDYLLAEAGLITTCPAATPSALV
jgi:hypothetical protein